METPAGSGETCGLIRGRVAGSKTKSHGSDGLPAQLGCGKAHPVSLSWAQWWPYALAAIALGLIVELLARMLRLWVYERSWMAGFNVLVVFGLGMGTIASQLPRRGALVALVLGASTGLLYELLNLRVLHWWSFPLQRAGVVRGHAAILALLTLAWGFVPPLAWALRVTWPTDRAARTLQERLDDLEAREQHLLGKLRALHEREDEIERRLELVRSRKRPLAEKLQIRDPAEGVTAP